MMKAKYFFIVVLSIIILCFSLLPASASEQAENTTVQVVISEPATVPVTADPASGSDYDVTQISKYGFIVVVGILSIIVGMMSAKAFSFWKW